MLPILAIDGCTAGECVRRSARLVKERWGEALSGNVVIGAWAILVAVPLAFMVGIVDAVTHNRTDGWVVFIGVMVVVGSVTWAATRVFSVALYRYATTGQATGPFTQTDVERPFRQRRRLF